MGRPHILIIPGASALPEMYHLLVKGITSHGYPIEALHIPSVGNPGPRPGPAPTMYDDAAFIARRVTELADDGRDVILVTHSYGGTPATESVKGLSKSERQKRGLDGGIVGLGYMTSLVPEVGSTAGSIQAGLPDENKPPTALDENGWMYCPDIPRMASLLFSNVPKEQAEELTAKLAHHSGPSFGSPLTYPGYKDVPVSYLLCEEDVVIPPFLQQAGIDMIERETGRAVHVTSIKGDHGPPLSSPELVVEWTLDLARRLQQE